MAPPGNGHGRVEKDGPERGLGLDLARALAVMMVLVGHWANNVGQWFHVTAPHKVSFAGQMGVELFFALSGFLIGRILLDIIDTRPEWRDFRVFMIRRAMRTLPLYFLWLALLLLVFPPRQDGLAVALRFLTLTQNLTAPMPPDYYTVTWSLTVEEWFYLLFGGGLILGARLLGGARALWLCFLVFLLGPLLLRLAFLDWSPHSWEVSKQVFFRIDEIAYGVLMAKLWRSGHWLFRHPWPPLLIGLLCVGAIWSGQSPLLPGLVPPLMYNVTIIGWALCLPAALRLRRASMWFEMPVRWIAARSYALYLVHLTILVDVAQNLLWAPGRRSAPLAAVVAIALPFVLAELSYRFVEGPILRRRPRQTRPGHALAAGASGV